jgi:hypothetical protein
MILDKVTHCSSFLCTTISPIPPLSDLAFRSTIDPLAFHHTLRSMSSGVEDFVDSEAYTIPRLQDTLAENGVTAAPTPDGLVSSFAHDLESGDPIPNLFSFQAGSHQELDYVKPTVHKWRYLGNRSVSLGGRDSEAYLFAVDLKQRLGRTKNGSNDHIHEGVTARVLLTEKGTQDDTKSPEAILSIDNFLNTIEYEMHDRYDLERKPGFGPICTKKVCGESTAIAGFGLEVQDDCDGRRRPQSTSSLRHCQRYQRQLEIAFRRLRRCHSIQSLASAQDTERTGITSRRTPR